MCGSSEADKCSLGPPLTSAGLRGLSPRDTLWLALRDRIRRTGRNITWVRGSLG